MTRNIRVIILAAGQGTRMQSLLPKVLHQIAGQSMLEYIMKVASFISPTHIQAVVSEQLMSHKEFQKLADQYKFQPVVQYQQLGTGDALKVALSTREEEMPEARQHSLGRKILVLYGDVPFISARTAEQLLSVLDISDVAVLGFESSRPQGYGRLITSKGNKITQIIEEKETTEQQKKLTLCNAGIIAMREEAAKAFISAAYSCSKKQGKENYLTDIVSFINSRGGKCTYILAPQDEIQGINDKIQLAKAEEYMQDKLRQEWLWRGVTMINPKTVFLSADTELEEDVVLYPNVYLGKGVRVGKNTKILPFCHIEGAIIGAGSTIGPFARLRPETVLGEAVKIGNFIEVKNSTLKAYTKAMHLSYIGDAKIGESCNVGAGTIFCNYDGKKKHECSVGNNTFIGSNTTIIAPRQIGNEVTVAAASTITEDIPDKTLAITRVVQKNLNKLSYKQNN